MGCLRILLATFTTVLFISLLGSSSANAQSFIDTKLELKYPDICEMDNLDITYDWINVFTLEGYERGFYDNASEDYKTRADYVRQGILNDTVDFHISTNKDFSGGMNSISLSYVNKGMSSVYLTQLEGFSNLTLRSTVPSTATTEGQLTIMLPSCNQSATSSSNGRSDVYLIIEGQSLGSLFISTFEYNYALAIEGYNDPNDPPIPDSLVEPTKTPVWLNYSVKFIEGKKMIIQSDNWTNYRDKHGGGIRYGDVGGTSDITLCRIEDKDNTGCVESLAFVENHTGLINLEYPSTMVGQVGYYKVFIDNTNKEPKIPPFDEDDFPFDVKNRSIIIFNDGTSTIAIDTVGYYEDESYFPQYDDNVYYNKFMNHNLVDDHGLLNVVLAPIGYLSELPDVTCQPLNLPMPARFGEDINLPCMTESVYQPQFPAIFQIYQLLITAVFSYMVGLRLFQNIKEMSSEKDDSIEVVKL